MSVAILCCQALELEIREIAQSRREVDRIEVLEWGLHIHPDRLLREVADRIRSLENQVAAVMLGYGRCQAMDRLPADFRIPVFYPPAEDCIGVLLGQEQYTEELLREAGTWFLTPGWTRLGMEFVFHELQLNRFAESSRDPMETARRVLKDFTRGLFIDPGVGDQTSLLAQARLITETFGWRLEQRSGSLALLKDTLEHAIRRAAGRRESNTPPAP